MNKFGTYWQSFRKRMPSFSKGSPERTFVKDFVIIYCGVYMFTTNVLSYKLDLRDYKIGDVVISKSMDDPNKTVCKRVKGVAGDMVYFKDKHRAPVLLRVPEGHVWLLGDNPSNSNDSRFYGPVPLGMVQGRIFFKIGLNPPHASLVDTIYLKDPGNAAKQKEASKEENKGDSNATQRDERKEEGRMQEPNAAETENK